MPARVAVMTTTPGQAPAVTMAPTGQRPAIDLSSVTKSFGKVHAVRGIDLQVQPGEVVAFLGPNGAGKTTTIDMLLGLSKPDSGTVEVFGMHPAAGCRTRTGRGRDADRRSAQGSQRP